MKEETTDEPLPMLIKVRRVWLRLLNLKLFSLIAMIVIFFLASPIIFLEGGAGVAITLTIVGMIVCLLGGWGETLFPTFFLPDEELERLKPIWKEQELEAERELIRRIKAQRKRIEERRRKQTSFEPAEAPKI